MRDLKPSDWCLNLKKERFCPVEDKNQVKKDFASFLNQKMKRRNFEEKGKVKRLSSLHFSLFGCSHIFGRQHQCRKTSQWKGFHNFPYCGCDGNSGGHRTFLRQGRPYELDCDKMRWKIRCVRLKFRGAGNRSKTWQVMHGFRHNSCTKWWDSKTKEECCKLLLQLDDNIEKQCHEWSWIHDGSYEACTRMGIHEKVYVPSRTQSRCKSIRKSSKQENPST